MQTETESPHEIADDSPDQKQAHRWMLGLLVAIAIVGGGIWAFVELADEVREGDTASFDERILLSMRVADDSSDPVGPGWLEEMGRDLTALGGVAVLSLLTLASIIYLLLIGKYRTALVVFLAIGSGILVSSLLKGGFDRPRPSLVPHGSHVATSSFPSGHSMMSALCYLTLGTLLAAVQKSVRLKAYILSVSVLLTIMVGISRVYLGVHWPTDVFAGWLAGAVWAAGAWAVVLWFQTASSDSGRRRGSRSLR